MPDNYYERCIATINRWKTDYPATYNAYKQYLKAIGRKVADFESSLRQFDAAALSIFRDCHQTILSGAPLIRCWKVMFPHSIGTSVKRFVHTRYILDFLSFSMSLASILNPLHQTANVSKHCRTLQSYVAAAMNLGCCLLVSLTKRLASMPPNLTRFSVVPSAPLKGVLSLSILHLPLKGVFTHCGCT